MCDHPGERIRSARRARGLTQHSVARRLGCNEQKVIRLERGAQWPRLDEAIALAEILDVDLNYIAGLTKSFRVDPSVIPGLKYAEHVIEIALKEVQGGLNGNNRQR